MYSLNWVARQLKFKTKNTWCYLGQNNDMEAVYNTSGRTGKKESKNHEEIGRDKLGCK